MTWLSWLPYPFELQFMQRALVAGLVVGAFAPLIGTFLVQKRMSLIGDGIGHLAFAGVAAGLLVGIWPVWTALAVAIVGALGVEWLRARGKASGDLALALFFYSGLALGVVLVGLAGSLNANLFGYLFGAILTVSPSELWVVVALGIVIVLAMGLVRGPMFAVVSDEEWARVAGLPVDLLNGLLAVITACAIVTAMRVVGVLLVAALMVLPVASGQLLARSFRGTLRWSVLISEVSVLLGLIASRVWGLAPGGAIVLVAAVIFALVGVLGGRRSAERSLRALAVLPVRTDERPGHAPAARRPAGDRPPSADDQA
jgi:zinc transport system permease protein